MSGSLIGIYAAGDVGAPMHARTSGLLITDLGLDGDRKAKAGSHRQVLVMPAEVLAEFDLRPGEVRENLTIRGIDVMALPAGTQLRVGAALIEATKPCAPCDYMDRLRPGLREAMKDCRGMLFRVLAGAEIHLGDVVEVLA